MIRILQIGMTYACGGIENYIMNYYRNIDRNSIQFDFINIYEEDLYSHDEIKKLGGNVYRISSYYKHPLKFIKEMRKIIEENHYEIVHCNMSSAVFLYPLIAAKLAKVKVIIAHAHNSSSDKGVLKSILHKINKNFIPFFANTYFSCSSKASAWFFNKKILKSNNYYIVKNAIEIDKYLFNEKIRKQKRNELGIDSNTIVLGHVGRLVKPKNHLFLIDIFYEVQKQNVDSKLLLIGTGPLKAELEKKVKQLNLNDKVLFLGQRSDVNELMQVMDLFVFPSFSEGLGIVLVEAQCSGLSCFASNVIPDEAIVTDKLNLIDLNCGLDIWAKQILKCSENDIVRKKYKNELSSKGYDIKVESKKLKQYYYEALH